MSTSESQPYPTDGGSPMDIPAVPRLPDPEELRMLQQATAAAERLHAQYASLRLQEEQLEVRASEVEALRVEIDRTRAAAQAQAERREEDIERKRSELNDLYSQVNEREKTIADYEERLKQLEIELQRKREAMTAEVMREVEVERAGLLQLQKTFSVDRENFNLEMTQKRGKWENELTVRRENLDRERTRLEGVVREEVNAEFDDFRREKNEWLGEHQQKNQLLHDQMEELQQQREQFENHLNAERQRMESELALERDKFNREQTVLGNRYRFQLEHLNRSREEHDSELRLFRREKQQLQLDSTDFRELHQQRLDQFEQYRELLAERETAIQRQMQLLQEATRTQEAETSSVRRRRNEDREQWDLEQKKQRAELQRQSELLAAQAENLEERHHRLDELRDELERTHAATLEARIAVEEIFAQISQSISPEAAEERVAGARTAISEHYRKLRDSLADERSELTREREAIDGRLNELGEVRSDLSDWIAEREEKLRLKEVQLTQYEDSSEEREQAWRKAQARWQNERIEAEGIIRDLLKQISDIHLPAVAATIQPTENATTQYQTVVDTGQIVPDELEPVDKTDLDVVQPDDDLETTREAA